MEEIKWEENVYVRLLELMALAMEDWGKVTENTNNYLFKGWDVKDAEAALTELRKLKSPLLELEGCLSNEIQRLTKKDNKAEESRKGK